MDGKLVIQLKNKAFFKSNVYEVFVDGSFVGCVDYRNRKVEHLVNFGMHQILVKDADYEAQNDFILSSKREVLPIDINENYFWSPTNTTSSKILRGVLFGFLLVYTLMLIFLLFVKQTNPNFYLILPFFLLLVMFFNTKKKKKIKITIKE